MRGVYLVTALAALTLAPHGAAQTPPSSPAAQCLSLARGSGYAVEAEYNRVEYTLVEAGVLCLDLAEEVAAASVKRQLAERGVRALRDSGDRWMLAQGLRRAVPFATRNQATQMLNEAEGIHIDLVGTNDPSLRYVRSEMMTYAGGATARRLEGQVQAAAATAQREAADVRSGRMNDTGTLNRVRVLFATNRQVSGSGALATDYSGRHSDQTRYGDAVVTVERTETANGLPRRYSDQPRPITVTDINPIRDQAVFRTTLAAAAAAPRREALVFIHGYNTSMEGGLRAAANLAHVLEIEGAVLLYSWPSRGTLLGYATDGRIATNEASIGVLESVLTDVSRSGATQIYIVAHSMGNRLLVGALERARGLSPQGGENAVFDEIVFASPDVDADDFMASVGAAQRLAGRLTLYASTEDRALRISRWLHLGDGYRAGQVEANVLLSGLDTINTSAAVSSGYQHDDFVGPARDDLRGLLWFSLTPAQRCVLSSQPIAGLPAPRWNFAATQNRCAATPFRIALSYLRQHNRDYAAARTALIADTAHQTGSDRADYQAAQAVMAGLASP
jgi:esterase/lipase superfamily enzyme